MGADKLKVDEKVKTGYAVVRHGHLVLDRDIVGNGFTLNRLRQTVPCRGRIYATPAFGGPK